MKCPQVVIGFVATVSAIYAYFSKAEQGGCGGVGLVYQKIEPRMCYTAPGYNYLTVGHYGIPIYCTITAYLYIDGACTHIAQRGLARGTTNMCLGPTGNYYNYFGDKGKKIRREAIYPDTCAAEDRIANSRASRML
ncbi:hypothetical protein P171DRAFT_447708 [Karstenula rhodostoma CBS 690.94]|uniref:Uncharacterized protein n=1 Tax=Karstenula rhodostoma CBS 690.94 TaxID=1392251 RepID=A0A9P4U7D5_9PLEO|nr:hypothetical protein P171DRAFT_447708 [Karstenula rhodostoma CBS 690.94]